MSDCSVNGEWPNIEGGIVEEFIAQEFWCEGKREDEANVLYIKISSSWHRLYFDYSIIFWRIGDNGLFDEKADRGKEFGYPLVNWGKQLSIVGHNIVSCAPKNIENGAQVKFLFSNGKEFTVNSINDATTIKTKQGHQPRISCKKRN